MTTPAPTTAVARPAPSASSQLERVTIKSLLAKPEYQARFKEVLGKRANQFVASVISLGNTLPKDVDPMSVVAAAMTAAVLDLPVDKNLGFAWIVPFKKNGVNYGQFMMGFKGYIQLGLRSGQYKRMNARAVNIEAVGGFDSVGEPVIDWTKVDDSKPIVGYVFAFEMVNGYTKICYWSKERVEEHAKRYSQSYRGGYDSPWKSHFDRMALKTVIKNELSAWGIMSIDMQSAVRFDQAVQKDLNAEPEFIDADPERAPSFEKKDAADLLGDKKGKGKKAADKAPPIEVNPLVVIREKMKADGIEDGDLIGAMLEKKLITDDSLRTLEEVELINPTALAKVVEDWETISDAAKQIAGSK